MLRVTVTPYNARCDINSSCVDEMRFASSMTSRKSSFHDVPPFIMIWLSSVVRLFCAFLRKSVFV